MRILLGVASQGAPELLRALDPLVSLSRQELVLVHVLDNGAREEMELAGGRLRSRPIPRHRLRKIGEAERQAARAALDEAVEVALALGALPETLVEEGEPGAVLCRRIEERGCELAVVAPNAGRLPIAAGPKSVGHTARFVLDHSPRPVLLIRGQPAPG
jgi:nucleotide-binding universal stress UspA family protein